MTLFSSASLLIDLGYVSIKERVLNYGSNQASDRDVPVGTAWRMSHYHHVNFNRFYIAEPASRAETQHWLFACACSNMLKFKHDSIILSHMLGVPMYSGDFTMFSNSCHSSNSRYRDVLMVLFRPSTFCLPWSYSAREQRRRQMLRVALWLGYLYCIMSSCPPSTMKIELVSLTGLCKHIWFSH